MQQALLRILEGTTITVKGGRASASTESTPAYSSAAGPWWPPHQQRGDSQSADALAAKRKGPTPGAAGSASSGTATYHLDTSNILFVLSGAFVGLDEVVLNRIGRAAKLTAGSAASWALARDELQPQDLHKYGLIPEFVGRLPIIASLSELTQDELVRVLTEPKNALVAQYEALFAGSDVTLKTTTPAVRSIARQAATKGTGARGLRRILEDRLLEAMYTSPGSSIRYALLDKKAADGEAQVQLFGRGGRHLFWSHYDDEQQGGAGTGMGIKVAGAGPQARTGAQKSPQREEIDATSKRIRRQMRYRMLRPTRVGNMRVYTM